jgi:hypothetical protein
MSPLKRNVPPIVKREGDRLVAYVGLEGRVTAAWIELFQNFVARGWRGFTFEAGNVLPGYPAGPGIAASVKLEEIHEQGADERVVEALLELRTFVDATDKEDDHRNGLASNVSSAVQKWWDELPNE